MSLVKLLNTMVFTVFLVMSSQTWAHEKGDLNVGFFWLQINTELNDEPLVLESNGAEIPNLALSVESKSMPAIGLTYFITDNIAIESYLGVPPRYDVQLSGGEAIPLLSGIKGVASTEILAALAFLQYYYTVPNTPITLHVGAGFGYAVFHDIEVNPIFYSLDPDLSFSADDSLAAAFQLGAEVNLNDNLTARLTYGKMTLSVDAQFSTGILGPVSDFTTTINVNPDLWIIGMGYKF